MTKWTSDQLDKVGSAEELQIQSVRRDGTLRKPGPCGRSGNSPPHASRPRHGSDPGGKVALGLECATEVTVRLASR